MSTLPLTEVETFDVTRVREEFPILKQTVHGRPLIYLDNANTSQKPFAVLHEMERFYREENANIHRATHLLSERATQAYEGAREKLRRYLNAASQQEIVFTRGTTEAINLVAFSYGQAFVKAGDEILITTLEHHSNIVPWQLLCQRSGAVLKVASITDSGDIDLEAFEKLLSRKTRLVAVGHVSNALGTVNPVKKLTELAHAHGAPILIDGAQAMPHLRVDVAALDCDFYALSGHKMYGPTGIGALYGKASWLDRMPPYQGGGDMIESVSFEETTYNVLPYKFEAGTANIAGGAGFGATVDYLSALDWDAVTLHEHDLLSYATERMREVPGLTIVGTAKEKAGVISFTLASVHPHDIGTILDREGIAIRTGHHCAQPVMTRFGLPATARVSFALYNTRDEVDALVDGLAKVIKLFS